MLRIERVEITNFVCFDHIEFSPSTNKRKPLTVIRAENGSGKTTFLRAIRWGMYGEKGLPGNSSRFSLHPAAWTPGEGGIETKVSILFETDGSSRNHAEGTSNSTKYELRRTVTTLGRKPATQQDPDFRRVNEEAQLLIKQSDGSWIPHEHGVDRVIDELLPFDLQDFFVMDADEVADFVGGSENKVIHRPDVIAKTSFAVRALLGLEIFDDAKDRLQTISDEFGRAATKASGDKKLNEQQAELDSLRQGMTDLANKLRDRRYEKTDIDDRLLRKREQLEAVIGSTGAHDELKERLKDNDARSRRANDDRQRAAAELSGEVASIELFASLAANEVSHVRNVLQPLYDDGSIPVRHLAFVKSLLDSGTCVCGQDLTLQSDYRHRIRRVIEQSSGKEESANYLAQVLHAANTLGRLEDGQVWALRCEDRERRLAELDTEISELKQSRRSIDAKLDSIDSEEVNNLRSHIVMLEEQARQLDRELAIDKDAWEKRSAKSNSLEGDIRVAQRSQAQARDLQNYKTTASALVQILETSYANIRNDQVRELSSEMNSLFGKMAANVVDDEEVEGGLHKATLRMIAEVGLRPLDHTPDEYEIYALNSRGRSMPPTEINGASRRILALSFVLGLCRVSRTFAPLVADSLLNFMSGSVRTNTLRVTSESASQPILLLTGADLESQNEVDLISRYAGATYTLTGQWQHVAHGGDVVNQSDERQVSLLCTCGPRQFCNVCERQGQADSPHWVRRQ